MGGRDAGRAEPWGTEGGGGADPGLTPRGPRTRAPRPVGSCRQQLRDGERRGSGTGRRGPRGPGRPHAPGAALGKGPRGHRRQPRAESGSHSRRGRHALGRSLPLLPVSERAGLSGRGWPWWSRGFFCQKPFGGSSQPGAPQGHTGNPESRARGAGPGGGGCRAGAPGAGAQPWGAASAAPASPGDPGEKLREKFPAWRRVAWEGRRSRSGPAGGEAKNFTQGTLPLYLLPEGASKSPLDSLRPEAGRLLHISDRWPCCLLLDASTDDELTTSQSSLFLHQARRLIHLSWVPHLDGSRWRKSVSLHKYNYSNSGGTRRPLL